MPVRALKILLFVSALAVVSQLWWQPENALELRPPELIQVEAQP